MMVASCRIAAWSMCLACTATAGVVLWDYPVGAAPLAACVVLYAALLWQWPAAFLVVLPVAVPAFDLGMWSGRLLLDEADLFVLATLAVLPLRVKPRMPRLGQAGFAVAGLAGCWIIAGLTGLASSLDAPASDNPLLQPVNAIRIGKSLAEALALLPFILSLRRSGWFACGMAGGLIAVGLAALLEKWLFSNVLTFDDSYRVVGPFSSMRLGGGYIGAYAAMALPFAVGLLIDHRSMSARALGAAAALAGGYTIIASVARTAFAAALAGLVIPAASRRAALAPMLAIAAVLACLGAVTGLRERFATAAPDWLIREDNWRTGLAARDPGLLATLFGTGLGTYPRAMLARGQGDRPSNLLLEEGGVVMDIATPFYLGQKIVPRGASLHLRLQARAPNAPNAVVVLVCDKVLLYSDNCRGQTVPLPAGPDWVAASIDVPAANLGAGILGGWITRPVEFSISAKPGRIQVRGIDLRDDGGRALLANADFSDGLDRWVFTDDSHLPWRIKNQYLMLFFETGLLGLLTFLGLAVLAMGAGGAVAGSVVAFLVSGLFDNLLEVPRLSLLFFLVCFIGLSDLTGRRG